MRTTQSFAMLVGTGTPLTLLAGTPSTPVATEKVGFDLLDPTSVAANPLDRPCGALSRRQHASGCRCSRSATAACRCWDGILGGDILRRYSVDIRFGAACRRDGGAVLDDDVLGPHRRRPRVPAGLGLRRPRFSLAGGGEVTAEGDPDVFGQRGPLVLAPTRIVLRTCAVPADFSPDMPRETVLQGDATPPGWRRASISRCCSTPASVRSCSAGPRGRASRPGCRPNPSRPPASCRSRPGRTAIAAIWSTIPRFALVDLEIGAATNPGPCVELGRARRIEQVSAQLVKDAKAGVASTACTQPCDNDPREPEKAQNSAAYLELTAQIPVAVIADDEPYLQGLRFDVRPEGPELDGVLGAGAMGRSRVEIDYLSGPPRAVFSCELDAPRSECWAAARCPRLPDASFQHLCFGLGYHGLAASCAPSGC